MGSGRRVFAACLTALLVAATLAPATAAAAAPCATGQEAEALRVRSLQNKLMVAALSCGQGDRYDAFIGRFERSLVEKGRLMTAYFTRRHGGKGTKGVRRVMDDYLTSQANQHSLDSMTDRTGFCRAAGETFALLLVGGEADLVASAVALPADRVESPLACLQPVKAVAKTPGSGGNASSGG